MRLLYDFGIWIYSILLRIIAPFHPKAKLWVDGRKGLLTHISQQLEQGQEHIWFHFASLGEFEQGRAILEQIRKRFPHEKIVITFFSPSGYEIRKHTNLADYVFYLPTDTASHAKRFISLVKPKFVVFTKYEYWYHYFKELKKQDIRLLMISAIFREEQIFFKPYGSFFKQILKNVSFFFAQNIASVQMLKAIGITQAGLAGDTRFDRVIELPKTHTHIPGIQQFLGGAKTLVAGSTWRPDDEKLQLLAQRYSDWKFIIAPHEVHKDNITQLTHLFPGAILYSEMERLTDEQIQRAQVLVIDNIGMLSALYYYADIAYVGGGFGVGIHNTLEAAAYGIPVIFGPKYEKYQEAVDLVVLGAGFSIDSQADLYAVFEALINDERRHIVASAAGTYVQQRAGATQIIMKYLTSERLLVAE
ncbi:3-deoxy-D-manno-octulosonic acid transferase [Sphingobacterium sp. Mn56C]|uniref:3-deoxy-D-manno-octulosonic acid transferase n=1 Tax=Sphingobacterium sp. Mn56C TaxID=3395261 RepID=UPI003BB9C199